MIMMGAAFLATGYILLRTAENPVRAVLLWVANPLLIVELVMGGHLDAFLALVAIAAIVLSRRCTRLWHDLAVGLLVGIAGGIKINAAFVALAIAIPLIHDRAWAPARPNRRGGRADHVLPVLSSATGLARSGRCADVQPGHLPDALAAGPGHRAALLRQPRGGTR